MKGLLTDGPLVPAGRVEPYVLSEERADLLRRVIQWAEEREIEVVATLPWRLTSEGIEEEQRSQNLRLKEQL